MSSSVPSSSPAPSATWRLGAVIGRRYRLDGELGRGGFGTVFRATRLDDRTPVALKLLASSKRHDETTAARFLREADLARRLAEPSTVRVLDFGDAGDGTPFIVFELLEGSTLEAWLAPRGPISPGEALFVMLALLASLEEAHGLGIIHRDIKPANVLVRPGAQPGSVKLLDFGIAKLANDEAALTREGLIIGTAAYMAPEQIDGSAVGPATDLYAAALVLAEMLAGAPLYEGEPMAICLRKLKEGRVTLPDAVAMSPFGGVIERATRRAPEARYGSAAELRAALAHTGVVPRPLDFSTDVPRAAPFASTALVIHPSAQGAPPRATGRRLAALAVGAALLLATGAAWVWLRPTERASPPRTARSAKPTAVVAPPQQAPRRDVSWEPCARAPRSAEAAAAAITEEAAAAGYDVVEAGDAYEFYSNAFRRKQRANTDWYAARALKKDRIEVGSVAVYGTDAASLEDLAGEMPLDATLARAPSPATMVVLWGLPRDLEIRLRTRLCGGS